MKRYFSWILVIVLAADVRDESGYLRLADLRNTLQEQ